MRQYLQCGRYRLPLNGEGVRPLVMGVLNVTPDSFSDGGQFHSLELALSHAEQMIVEGVDIIDIGGESSRPGTPPLPLEEELRRVMPVLYALRDCGKPLSIDTYKPEVMREALLAGADMINDITGFRSAGALTAVNESDCALCIMHMQNDPQSMQVNPQYEDIVDEVTAFLRERVAALKAEGVANNRLCIDPGFGFGKTVAHNLELLKNIGTIRQALDLRL
ncbi:MAG: dihydropteroate synthase, partial [Burkholderiaceae bacterium]